MIKRPKLADRLLALAVIRRDVGAVQRILVEFFGQRLSTADKLAKYAVNRYIARQNSDQFPFSDKIKAY